MKIESSHSSLSSGIKAEAKTEAVVSLARRYCQGVVVVNKKKEYGDGDEITEISSSSSSSSSSIDIVKENKDTDTGNIPIDINYSITMAASILKNIRAASSSSSSGNMIIRRKRRRNDDLNNKATTKTLAENDDYIGINHDDGEQTSLLECSLEKKIRHNYVSKKDTSKVSNTNSNAICLINEGKGKCTRHINNDIENSTKNSVVDVSFENNNDDDDVILTKETTEQTRPLRYSVFQTEKWDDMFQRLIVYKNEHTSTDVPKGYKVNPQLGHWVSTQRKLYNKNELSPQRIRRLRCIDFVWDSNEAKWNRMYQRLILYKGEHNESTMVPLMYEVEPKLGKWVKQQRMFYKKKELATDRVHRLTKIGFMWDPQNVKWDEMFHRLMEYKNQHRSVMTIPARYKLDLPLGKWAHRQRTDYRKKRLSVERLNQLESIGFYLRTK